MTTKILLLYPENKLGILPESVWSWVMPMLNTLNPTVACAIVPRHIHLVEEGVCVTIYEYSENCCMEAGERPAFLGSKRRRSFKE